MSPSPRRGISKKTTVSGTGLHTGARTEATFLPAPAGQGIVFKRVDLAGKPQIPALLSEVEAVERRTAIGKGESTIHTVSTSRAVAAHEIDDLTVELSARGHDLDGASALIRPLERGRGRAAAWADGRAVP